MDYYRKDWKVRVLVDRGEGAKPARYLTIGDNLNHVPDGSYCTTCRKVGPCVDFHFSWNVDTLSERYDLTEAVRDNPTHLLHHLPLGARFRHAGTLDTTWSYVKTGEPGYYRAENEILPEKYPGPAWNDPDLAVVRLPSLLYLSVSRLGAPDAMVKSYSEARALVESYTSDRRPVIGPFAARGTSEDYGRAISWARADWRCSETRERDYDGCIVAVYDV